VSAPPEYFPMIREICDRYDVLFIADEVMTGIGRTGENFAVNHWQVVPDIITTGKGVGGGYAPLGAMVVREPVYQTIAEGSGAFIHGFTYGGHPPSVAAGAAVLKYVEEHCLVAQAAERGRYLEQHLEPLRASRIVGDVRGKGLMWGIEFVRDKDSKEPFDRALRVAERIGAAAFKRGLIIYPGAGNVDGVRGDQLLVGPPLVITTSEIDELVDMLAASIRDVEGELTALGALR
jgi:adenosylmethionine-8-amino-7-oxononanoate aminotransferase